MDIRSFIKRILNRIQLPNQHSNTDKTNPLNVFWNFIKPTPTKVTYGLWIVFLGVSLSVYLYVKGVVSNYKEFYGEMPTFESLENPKSDLASELYSADGELLGKKFLSNRTAIKYDDLSKNMMNALLATEDIRFYEHSGIDMKGSFAILWYLLKGDKRGSSTISQQLAKNLYKTRGQNFKGSLSKGALGKIIVKTKEWITAAKIERSYTKNEIITMYLNTVDFGSNSFGVEVAAQTFFGVAQKDLKIEQAAMLTGLLKAPSAYSPILNPKNAHIRRNTVLDQLQKYHFISRKKSNKLKKEKIALNYRVENQNSGYATYFKKVVFNHVGQYLKKRREIDKHFNYDLYTSGIKIYTTLDSRLQKHAEAAVNEHMDSLQNLFFEHWKGRKPWSTENEWGAFREMKGFLEREIKKTWTYQVLKRKHNGNKRAINRDLNEAKEMRVFSYDGPIDTTLSSLDSLAYYLHFLHTGFVSMDPKTGEIKAWVGGINHKYFKYDHVKQGKRQPGSTFKPIVYATILGETGTVYSPCYKVVDAPVTFVTGDEDKPTWTPKNADGKFSGDTLTLRQAMARSVNSITAYMMKLMGDQTPFKVKDYAQRLGITSHLEPVPAMCLGTFDVSLYEMVGAYSTFANRGYYTKPHFITRIEDRFGNVIADFQLERKKELSDELAYVMLHMLMGATQERGGTGRGLFKYGLLDKDNEIGAKTGTTQNYSDGWFIGVTKDLVSGCWVGGEHRAIHFRTMEYGQGARMAMPIWANYMQRVYEDKELDIKMGPFEKPDIDFSIIIDCDKEQDILVAEELSEEDIEEAQSSGNLLEYTDEEDFE